jgi:hypothetical protein
VLTVGILGSVEVAGAGRLPARGWYRPRANADLVRVASFRFDDPECPVAVETMLVRTGSGPIHQVPPTYRDAPRHDSDRLAGLPLNGR